MRGKATRGRKRMHLLSDLMKGKYVALKRTAEDRKEWQKLLRADYLNECCKNCDHVCIGESGRPSKEHHKEVEITIIGQ